MERMTERMMSGYDTLSAPLKWLLAARGIVVPTLQQQRESQQEGNKDVLAALLTIAAHSQLRTGGSCWWLGCCMWFRSWQPWAQALPMHMYDICHNTLTEAWLCLLP
jgi:hypothetical protein